jgi:AAA domain/UvrD-like helicase C-terminal domain
MRATAEQQAAREAFAAGGDLALIAGAGAGKTSTLVLMGEATKRRGLYMAYNKAAAEDARRRFGPNVECRTSHALAYQAIGVRYADRLANSPRRPGRETARLLGISEVFDNGASQVTQAHQARLVMEMLARYCRTADLELSARHMPQVNGLEPRTQDELSRHLLPYAHRAWEDVRSLDGVLKFDHEHYMKMWGLTRPVLPFDFILLDEAQDTNPVVEEIFLAQSTQRVCVGDPAQQIYAWRNARDVMTGFPAEHLYLTESFRFGPPIAEEANRWLELAGSELRLTGRGPADARIGALEHPDAVLCRGNADAMHEVLDHLDQGTPVALVGGGRELRRLAEASIDLKAGRRTSHPELFLFATWGEVQDYAESDPEAQSLRTIVNLVDSFGPETIIDAVARLSAEDQARVIVSTAHKAKGREWDTVRIGPGFHAPPITEDGLQRPLRPDEARLIYVAVTRARHVLDQASLSWVGEYEKHAAEAGRSITPQVLAALPLTGQLKFPDSPISRFMAEYLPHTGRLHVQYLKFAASLPHPVQPLEIRSPAWAVLGHAIDYRLRLSLGSGLGDAVAYGVERVGGSDLLPGLPDPAARAALHRAGVKLQNAIRRHLAGTIPLQDADLSRLCVVAASYEGIYRTGRIQRGSMLLHATQETTLVQLTAAVPEYSIEDLARQLILADRPFAPYRELPAAAKVCGPQFAGSTDLGGADADFILDGLLLDCKATRQPRSLGPEEIYQLAGYLLLDYNDDYRINSLGLYLSRQGGLITWDVGEFLTALGARHTLANLRTLLRHRLRTAPRHPGTTALGQAFRAS